MWLLAEDKQTKVNMDFAMLVRATSRNSVLTPVKGVEHSQLVRQHTGLGLSVQTIHQAIGASAEEFDALVNKEYVKDQEHFRANNVVTIFWEVTMTDGSKVFLPEDPLIQEKL